MLAFDVVIPARHNSTRIANKPLVEIGGKPLVVCTARRAKKVPGVRSVTVATDLEEIVALCRQNDIAAERVEDAWCGTERVAKCVAEKQTSSCCTINWQVDEPDVDPWDVAVLAIAAKKRPNIAWTIAATLPGQYQKDTSVVKVAVKDTKCVKFSRRPMSGGMAHLGVYAFDTAFLLNVIAKISQSANAKQMRLEQVAWMDAGVDVRCVKTDRFCRGINVERDVQDYGGRR
jgi:3-deoxy-manno-octulosonate cytidylyltransferase (CMP-KDO synthetase)